jgi:hypothetical protein
MGLKTIAQIPIALVDEQPIAILLQNEHSEASSLLSYRRASWKDDVLRSYQVQSSAFKDLQKAADPKLRAQTLSQAKEALRRSHADHDRLTAARKELVDPKAGPKELDRAVVLEDNLLEEIQRGENALDKFIRAQDEILKVENDPHRRELLAEVEQGKLLEAEAEYDKAIALYDKIAADPKAIEGVKKRADDLRSAWSIKSPEHQEARTFVYETWPKVPTDGLEAGVAKASAHLKTLKAAGDKLTPRKLLMAINNHAARLKKELEPLNEINPDDETKIKVIKNAAEALNKLNDEVLKAFPEFKPKS